MWKQHKLEETKTTKYKSKCVTQKEKKTKAHNFLKLEKGLILVLTNITQKKQFLRLLWT